MHPLHPLPIRLCYSDTRLEQHPTSTQLAVNMDPISEAEVRTAVNQLINGKAAGVDNIQPLMPLKPLELLKTAADSTVPYLTRVCTMVWQQEVTPVDWKNGIIIPLPKKGDLTECNNWRGITLLSVPNKVFARILLNRMKDAVDKLLQNQQAGFRPGRSCMDQIFSLRQIIEKVTEGHLPIIVNFVHFRKAFDCVHRPALWTILEQYGIPQKIAYACPPPPTRRQKSHRICINLGNDLRQKWGGPPRGDATDACLVMICSTMTCTESINRSRLLTMGSWCPVPTLVLRSLA